jgi:small conductance mechanosensitive channel
MGQGLADRAASAIWASGERLLDAVSRLLPAVAVAAAVLLMSWGLAALVRAVVAARSGSVGNSALRNALRHVSYYTVWGCGVLVALGVLGAGAHGVLGLGFVAVALGIALKDILSNLGSGVLILMTQTVEVGGQIAVGDIEGTVEQVDLRATHIRTADGRLVLVPNGDLFTSRITIGTASPWRRASVCAYLDYRQDVGHALATILEAVACTRGVATDPPPTTHLRDLAPEQLCIEARFWTDSRAADLRVDLTSTVRMAIVNALVREGITLPTGDERRVTLVEAESNGS